MSGKPLNIFLFITLTLSVLFLIFVWSKVEIMEHPSAPDYKESAKTPNKSIDDTSLTTKQNFQLNLTLPEENNLNSDMFNVNPLHFSNSE